jgi:hypothetical protein
VLNGGVSPTHESALPSNQGGRSSSWTVQARVLSPQQSFRPHRGGGYLGWPGKAPPIILRFVVL